MVHEVQTAKGGSAVLLVGPELGEVGSVPVPSRGSPSLRTSRGGGERSDVMVPQGALLRISA